jgi:hypothetical protein
MRQRADWGQGQDQPASSLLSYALLESLRRAVKYGEEIGICSGPQWRPDALTTGVLSCVLSVQSSQGPHTPKVVKG